MKTFLFTILASLSCLLFSCKEDVDGIGTNPELNIENYTFPREGGTLEVYSQRGHSIWPIYDSTYDYTNTPPEKDQFGLELKGEWYRAAIAYENGRLDRTKIHIEVQPNNTGEERIVPIAIEAGNYFCWVVYKQEK